MRSVLVACVIVGCSAPRQASESTAATRAAVTKDLPKMHAVRKLPCAALLADGRVLVAGGENRTPAMESSAEVFDPKTSTWTVVAPMNDARTEANAVRLADGRVLVAGGGTDAGISSAEIYDPAKNTWARVSPMRTARHAFGMAVLGGGTILVAGGRNDTDGNTNTAETYDVATDTWSSVGAMARNRYAFVLVPLADGRALAAGDVDAVVEIYDPSTKTFHDGKGAQVTREGSAAARLADGRVLITGGDATIGGVVSTEAFLFDPKTETTTATTAMPVARTTHSLSLLPSGSVLMYGGENSGKMLLFDPTKATWNDAGFAIAPRWFHAAVTLNDGSVLMAGGSLDPTGFAGNTETAELFVNDVVTPPPPSTPPSTTVSGVFSRCAKDGECSTGHCVDGVCCDTECTGACHSCALPSAPGVCTLEPVGVDLRGECGAQATCSGTCGPNGTCIGSTAGSLCARSRCVSATTGIGPAACTAPGARCPSESATAFDCGPYTCEPAFGACRTSCVDTSDCAGGYVCDGQVCVAPAAPSSDGGCSFGARARSARPKSGWVTFALAALALRRKRRMVGAT